MREAVLKQVSTLFKMDQLNYQVWKKLDRTEMAQIMSCTELYNTRYIIHILKQGIDKHI